MRLILSAAAVLVVASVALPAPSAGQAARTAAFAQCAGCHSTEAGRNVFGPSLAGIAGRRAGSLPGYAYSPALRQSGLVWNAATLDRWLAGPQRLVPGTKMPFAGISDAKARREVVAYLATLK